MERLDPEADRKPFALGEGEKPIKLRLQRQTGPDVCYKISRKMPLKPLLLEFYQHFGLVYKYTRFLYEGKHLNEVKTPEELQMEDEDIIDAFNDQVGGA